MKRLTNPSTFTASQPWLGRSLVLLMLLLAPFAAGCSAESNAAVSDPASDSLVRVRVAEVERGQRTLTIDSAGRIASKAELSLSFKTSGIVQSITVDEGSRVSRGELLARLDLAEIEAQASQARAALEKAQRDLRRAEGLYTDEAVTLEQVENARTAVELAVSDLEIAEFNLRYSEIRSPANGWILRRVAEPGELVQAGQPVLVLGSADSGWVMRLGLPDRDVVRLRRGDRARVNIDALPGEVFDARVAQIGETATPGTGTYEVELEVQEADPRLKSGFVARASIEASETSTSTAIPIEALVRADGVEGLVYALDDSPRGWRPVPITIARIEGGTVVVASGLEGVEAVVTDGAQRLNRTSTIEVVEP